MNRFAAFRGLRSFSGDVVRLLAQLEQNIREKVESDNFKAFGPFEVTAIRKSSTTARFWQLVRVDPTLAALRVSLPSPREPDAGWIVIKNDSDSVNTVTARPIGGTIEGADEVTLSEARGVMWLAPDRASNNWIVASCCGDAGGLTPPVAVSDLAPGTNGDVLTTVGGVAAWAAPSGTGGSWGELLDVDFTAQSTFTYTSNGQSQTFDGHAFITDNFGASSLMEVTSGTGLRITVNNTNVIYGAGVGTRTAPNIILPMPDIDFCKGPVRLYVDYDVSGAVSDFQFLFATLEWDFQPLLNTGVAIGHATTLQRVAFTNRDVGSQAQANGIADSGTGSVELRYFSLQQFNLRHGTYSGGWPVVASSEVDMDDFDGRMSTAGLPVIYKSPSVVPYRFCFAVQTANVGLSWTAIIKRIRVEQWDNGY